jgi:hypothetical protein
VAEALSAANGALYVKSRGVEVVASETALEKFLDGWKFTLNWCEKNPLQFFLLVILLAWIVYQRRLGRTEVAAMKREFDERREANRQPDLGLPAPPKKIDEN